jgi:hypothetical protein
LNRTKTGGLLNCPILEQYGAATWGHTEAEALKNIEELVKTVIAELAEDNISIPEGPQEEVVIFPDTRVAVTI